MHGNVQWLNLLMDQLTNLRNLSLKQYQSTSNILYEIDGELYPNF